MGAAPVSRPHVFQAPAIVLYWLPVGAGAPSRVSQVASDWWEQLLARIERRPSQRLVHAALEIFVGDDRYVIEMAPEWSDPHITDRGVVARGPVGLRIFGRSRFFRYEVRCWKNGDLSDRAWVIGEPVVVSQNEAVVRSLLQKISAVPTLTWGRSVAPTRDMWNSNSLVSWLLSTAVPGAETPHPPAGCRAPGWEAGIAIARRQRDSCAGPSTKLLPPTYRELGNVSTWAKSEKRATDSRSQSH